MIDSVLDSLESHGFNQLYLPAAGFGVLVLRHGSSAPRIGILGFSESLYLVGFAAALLSATFLKTLFESIAGPPTGESKVANEAEMMQRIRYTLLNRGKPANYPSDMATPIWEADVPVPWYRVSLSLVMLMAGAITAISAIYTTWKLSTLSIENPDLILGSLAFIQIVAISEMFFSDIWPNTYLNYEYDDFSLNHRLEEFYSYTQMYGGLSITDGEYATDDGGTLKLEFELKEGEEIGEALEFLILGLSGTVVPDEFPCHVFEIVHKTEVEDREFSISSAKIDAYKQGYLSLDKIVQDLIDSR